MRRGNVRGQSSDVERRHCVSKYRNTEIPKYRNIEHRHRIRAPYPVSRSTEIPNTGTVSAPYRGHRIVAEAGSRSSIIIALDSTVPSGAQRQGTFPPASEWGVDNPVDEDGRRGKRRRWSLARMRCRLRWPRLAGHWVETSRPSPGTHRVRVSPVSIACGRWESERNRLAER